MRALLTEWEERPLGDLVAHSRGARSRLRLRARHGGRQCCARYYAQRDGVLCHADADGFYDGEQRILEIQLRLRVSPPSTSTDVPVM